MHEFVRSLLEARNKQFGDSRLDGTRARECSDRNELLLSNRVVESRQKQTASASTSSRQLQRCEFSVQCEVVGG